MTARVEDLLAEARWLEGLASALVGNREEARELVQEVWVRTLEERPQGVRNPRAWLARVLRNTLGMQRRAGGARATRDRAAARPEATAGTGEIVARAESLRLLVGAVLALEEPLCSTVLLRYFDGLSSAAIARRQGVPESTVRNRLAQALGELRLRLGRSRSDWRSSLALIVGADDARRVPLTTGAVVAAATLVLCGLGSAWWALRRPSAPEPAPSVARVEPLPSVAPMLPVLFPAREPLVASSPMEQGSLAVPAAATRGGSRSTTPPGVLEVEVLDEGVPCTHGGIFELTPDWYPWMSDEEPPSKQTLSQVGPGCARIEGLPAGDYGVRYVSHAHAPLSTSARITEEAGAREVLLGGTSAFHGTVWDDNGLPMPGAGIILTQREGSQTSVRARTATDGSYSFSGLAGGPYSGRLGLPDETDSEFFSRRLEAGCAQRLDFGRPSALPTWTGALVSRSGVPLAGAVPLKLFQEKDLLRPRTTDSDGRFALRLAPGTYDVQAQLSPPDRHAVQLGQIELTESGLQQDLVLPGTLLSGQVRFESGAPLPLDLELILAVDPLGHEKPFARRHALLDAEGRYTIGALEPGVYEFVVHPLELAAASLRIELGADDLARSLEVVLRDP